MLTFLYRDLDATDTDITEFVVLRFGQNPQGMAENAEERSVGAWDLQIEDNGVLDLHAQRTFYVFEDDTYDGNEVLWVGQTFDKHNGRGDTYRTGPGRVYTLSLVDLNTLLERRVIKSTDDPNRPEENDVERMLWLQSTGYIGLGTWISTDDPVDMDAVDYTGRMAAEVIEDCMGQSGKNSFMFRDPDTGGFSTFYGNSSADIDVLTSDIRISNVLSDIDEVTTWEALLDADLWEANSRIYSGVFANYDGGAVYQENATTVANFSHRDTTVSWPDVKSATKANARAIRYLADIGTEEYRITVNIEVPSDQVGFMPHAGYRLQARFSHYPLFTEFTWMRILARATTLIGPSRYRIQYELSPGTTGPPITCADAIAMAEHTADIDTYPISSGVSQSLPVSASSFDNAMQVMFWTYYGPNMGLGGCTLSVGGGWSELQTEDTNGSSIWAATGYLHQPTAGTPSNMTVTAMCTGGGPAEGIGHCFAFPASSFVQQSAVVGDGHAVLPSPPTVGNILWAWWVGSIGGADASGWIADGGTVLVDNESYDVGAFVMISMRCVNEGDTEHIDIPNGSHANLAGLVEFAP